MDCAAGLSDSSGGIVFDFAVFDQKAWRNEGFFGANRYGEYGRRPVEETMCSYIAAFTCGCVLCGVYVFGVKSELKKPMGCMGF